jgi:hypothetical protein
MVSALLDIALHQVLKAAAGKAVQLDVRLLDVK